MRACARLLCSQKPQIYFRTHSTNTTYSCTVHFVSAVSFEGNCDSGSRCATGRGGVFSDQVLRFSASPPHSYVLGECCALCDRSTRTSLLARSMGRRTGCPLSSGPVQQSVER